MKKRAVLVNSYVQYFSRFLRLTVLIGITAIFPKKSFSQIDINSTIDSLILTETTVGTSYEDIVKIVNSRFNSQESKARAYYRWIAENIEYDVTRMESMQKKEQLLSSTKITQNADTVFKNKKAVCEGLSNLMKKFCQSSGIECEVVPGYTRSNINGEVMQLKHSWNMIKIDSKWKALDVTWANTYSLSDGNYKRKFTGNYFLQSPQEFIKDHLPLDPMWQMLDNPITKEGFFGNTERKIAYFSLNDSLAAYFKTKESERPYLDAIRYHNFDPADTSFKRAIDVFHNNEAAGYLTAASGSYREYVNLLNKGFSDASSNEDCKKAIAMLNASKGDLTKALNYLKDIRALTDEFTRNFALIKSSAESNLSTVEKHLGVLKDYQKKNIPSKKI